jgi:hypothetical protein
MNSPELTLQANQANDNFMEDTFLCFAYRYKYKDGEYSATSQFSDPAFCLLSSLLKGGVI